MANQTTEVYELLKSGIIKGVYSPSESLPEQELSKQYGVSRNTIKKVLLMLEKENLVSIEVNKGAKVRSYSLIEVLEFLELRAILEGFIVRKSVPVITDVQLKSLEEILQNMKIHQSNQELLLYSQYNQMFHNIIFEACPNRTAVDTAINLKNLMRKYNSKTILVPGRALQSYAEHSAILDAIKSIDPDLAESLMVRHISNVLKTIEENFSLLF